MQPDVAPALCGHTVAEPLMRQLVGDQPLRPRRRRSDWTRISNALCLKRYLQVVMRDNHGVAVRRQVGPNSLQNNFIICD